MNNTANEVFISGYLKKIKKFYRSDKDYYRVIGMDMFKSDGPSKKSKQAYDLTNYSVSLSKEDKCRFYLNPIDDRLGLVLVKFEVSTVEERARWYKVLNYLTRGRVNGSDDTSNFIQEPHDDNDPEDLNTLTGISNYLCE